MPPARDMAEGLLWVLGFFLLLGLCDPVPAAEFSGVAVHQERTMDRYWTKTEQDRLLARLRQVPADDLEARRDAAMIRGLLHSGCRIGEFLRVSVGTALEALRCRQLYIPRDHRKGKRRDHKVLVTEALGKDLRELLAVRSLMVPGNCHCDDPLIVTRRQGGMSIRNAQLRVKHWAVAAGLPEHSSPHWARHTRGMNIMTASTARDPRGVAQQVLGHASLGSTGIYTQASREEVETVLAEIDAPARGRVTAAQLRKAYVGRAAA